MGKLTYKKTVANAFNNFFLTSEKLNRYKFEKTDAILYLKDSFLGNFPTINIIPITEAVIKGITSSLKPNNSSGYDEITSKIIKSCASLISICSRNIL